MRTNSPEKVVFTSIYLKPSMVFNKRTDVKVYEWELVTKLYSGLMETAVNICK